MKRQDVTVKSIVLLLMISALLITLGYSLAHAAEKAEQISSNTSTSEHVLATLDSNSTERSVS